MALGEDLHVRGGRAGETQWLLRGMPLNDPLRGRPMELPLLGVESAELVSGGLDPEFGGALAGVVQVRTVDPGPTWGGEVRWEGDALVPATFEEHTTGYGRVGARLGGPVGRGIGAVAAIDALTDDTYLPALRSREGRWSWRADNHLLGLLKIAPIGSPAPVALEILGSRWVRRPYDPMWSVDGYTTPCTGPGCSEGPGFSVDPQPGYQRYRAADHAVMTDERRIAAVLSATRNLGKGARAPPRRGAHSDGSRPSERPTTSGTSPCPMLPSSASKASRGTTPSTSTRATNRTSRAPPRRPTDSAATTKPRSRPAAAGAAAPASSTSTPRCVSWISVCTTPGSIRSVPTTRTRRAASPMRRDGGCTRDGAERRTSARLLHRRAPGRGAELRAAGARVLDARAARRIAYPVSTRDVMSFSYVRIEQAPPRDFLYDNRINNSAREPLGNPNLEPSTLISYQAAVKHLFEGGRALQVAYFFRDLFGQIGTRPYETQPGLFHQRYENADEGHAEGVELGLITPTGRFGQLEFQYTFMHAVGTSRAPKVNPTALR